MEEELHKMLWDALGSEKAKPIWEEIIRQREETREQYNRIINKDKAEIASLKDHKWDWHEQLRADLAKATELMQHACAHAGSVQKLVREMDRCMNNRCRIDCANFVILKDLIQAALE